MRGRAARQVPHDLEAEKSLLGAALLSPSAADTLVADVQPEDFYAPFHAATADAIRSLVLGGHPVDLVSVRDLLRQRDDYRPEMAADLLTLVAEVASTSNAAKYAAIVLDHAARRALITGASDLIEQAYALGDLGQIHERAVEVLASLELPVIGTEPDPDLDTFLARRTTTDWLVPGLIERGDRLILTGPEGYGKSTVLRQMAVQIASGCHPWTHRFIEPRSVLIVDCENTDPQIQRGLEPMAKSARIQGYSLDPERVRIATKIEGLDLTRRGDVRWLMERVSANRPDLVILGPLYKLHDGDPKEEGPAKAVAKALDTIRARFGCALLIEAHSPLAEGSNGNRVVRPYGASLWLRWPEFGLGIVPWKENGSPSRYRARLVPFRGAREAREWPSGIQRGGNWNWSPWVPPLPTEEPA